MQVQWLKTGNFRHTALPTEIGCKFITLSIHFYLFGARSP